MGLQEVLLIVGHEVGHDNLAAVALVKQRLVQAYFDALSR